MKLKAFVLSLLLGLFALTSCSLFSKTETQTETSTEPNVTQPEQPNTNPNPNPTPEVVIKEIYATGTTGLIVSLNGTFNPSGINVFAKYTDNTEVNITEDVSFSAVDTSTEGVKEITVTYQSFTFKFEVNVLTLTGVDINTDSAIVLYEVGQVIPEITTL